MKRSLVLALSIVAALAVAAPSIAQTEQTASGTVVSSSPTQIVIRTSDGRQMTFMTDADTNRPADLQSGANVTVRYHDMSGTLHAANVSATSGTTTTPSATTPSTTTPTTTAPSRTTPSTTTPAADPTGNDARMPQQPTDSDDADDVARPGPGAAPERARSGDHGCRGYRHDPHAGDGEPASAGRSLRPARAGGRTRHAPAAPEDVGRPSREGAAPGASVPRRVPAPSRSRSWHAA